MISQVVRYNLQHRGLGVGPAQKDITGKVRVCMTYIFTF